MTGAYFHDDPDFGTGYRTRGNLTSTTAGGLTQSSTYDTLGNVATSTYVNNTGTGTTTYDYTDSLKTYAFPTTVTDAQNNKTITTYDYNIGKPTSMKNPAGNISYYYYADAFDRVTQIRQPSTAGGSGATAYTNITYPNVYWTRIFQDKDSSNDQKIEDQIVYDAFGRETVKRHIVDAQNFIATYTNYDAMGRVSCTSNPTKIYIPNHSNDGFGYQTCRNYDSIGRVISVTGADSQVTTTAYGSQTGAAPFAQTTTVTDPASHATMTSTNAMGHVIAVVEDATASKLLTKYSYDTLGNLIAVQKCPATGTCPSGAGQNRSFVYDSLSRLTRASNPESGSVNYFYALNGTPKSTLQSRTDARASNNLATYSYDSLNRPTGVTYNDGTPNVSYILDSLGNQTSATSGSVVTTTHYDAANRPDSSTVKIGSGSTYTMAYQYDLANHLLKETYPSGRVMNLTYDQAGRAATIKGTSTSNTVTPYVQQVGYFPHGGEYYWQYGNNVWPTQDFTNLLQPYLAYATLNNDNSKYMLFLQANWNNNGTVGSHLECYGPPSQFSSLTCVKPSFWYDNLNRLTSATEAFYQNPSAGAGYSRAFNYDEYGNMTVASNSNVPLSGLTPVSNQNPINGVNNRLQSAIYGDARGNMTQVAAGSESMSYDGESRQIQTVDSGTTITYLYDAHGQRVQKQISGGATTVDVHDAFGKLIAEYSSVGVAPTCTTCYLSYDQLGSVRLITDQSQNIIGRHDYMPYGEEIFSGSAGRSGNGFGNSANIKQMFTGQERDGGTADLDYFNARHMSAVMARFTQPDPNGAGANIFNPQTWNGYAYVSGNPMSSTDPSGLAPCLPSNNYCGFVVFNTPSQSGLQFQTWDTFTALNTAFQPTAALVVPAPYNNGDNPGFGNVSVVPLYGNLGALATVTAASGPPPPPAAATPVAAPPPAAATPVAAAPPATALPTTTPPAPSNGPTPTPAPKKGNSWSHPFTPATCQQWKNWGKADAFLATSAGYITKQFPVAAPVTGAVFAVFGASAILENGIALAQGCFF